MTPPSDVVRLERLAAVTWRALEEEPYGDWLLRAGGGFTGRANSALVVGQPPGRLDDAVADGEQLIAFRASGRSGQVREPAKSVSDTVWRQVSFVPKV